MFSKKKIMQKKLTDLQCGRSRAFISSTNDEITMKKKYK